MSDPNVPHPPYERIDEALGDDAAAGAHVRELRDRLASPAPDPTRIRESVGILSRIRTIEAIVANWWDDPATQRWIKSLGDTGL